jgi:D-serine deaminase-like pyridoxal phosphate-dependent protein
MNLIGASLADYEIEAAGNVMTPALAIYADIVDDNIQRILHLLGDVNRWRPHIKTAKLAFTIERLVQHGVENMKCATTLELLTACEAGARDVLVAFPLSAASAARVVEIAGRFPRTRISVLVEQSAQVAFWRGTGIGLFIDLNSGMNRTGVPASHLDTILDIARAIGDAGLQFRGLHYYEGHHTQSDLLQRIATAHSGYDVLMSVAASLQNASMRIEEVITSGTPALPCALTYEPFRTAKFLHRVSPGTVVYNDCSSLSQLPREYGLQAAAVVLTSVVSLPAGDLITCDAGHKTVSSDAGVPNCAVLGHPELQPLRPSEEHLPLQLSPRMPPIPLGTQLYLVPRHVCPTVNNFDHALIVRRGRIVTVEKVTARGREMPRLDCSKTVTALSAVD